MKKIDLDRAIEAFRWACPNSTALKKLDGTRAEEADKSKT